MNMLDLLILITSMPQFLMGSGNVSFLRFMRLLRGGRALQAARFVRYSYSLQKMVSAFSRTVLAVFWVVCLMSIIVYIFGLAMMEGVQSYLLSYDSANMSQPVSTYVESTGLGLGGAEGLLLDLKHFYGGVGRTFFTLVSAISGGDWTSSASALSAMGAEWRLAWIVYLVIVVFGVFNMMTGLVVDILRHPVPADRKFATVQKESEEMAIIGMFHNELSHSGKTLEHIASMKFNRKSFEKFVALDRVNRELQAFGIEMKAMDDPFGLMDVAGTGHLDVKTAAQRCLQLRGKATSHSLSVMARDIRAIHQELNTLRTTLRKQMDRMVEQTEALAETGFAEV